MCWQASVPSSQTEHAGDTSLDSAQLNTQLGPDADDIMALAKDEMSLYAAADAVVPNCDAQHEAACRVLKYLSQCSHLRPSVVN